MIPAPVPGRIIRRGPRKGQFEPDPEALALASAQQEQRVQFLGLVWETGSVAAACKAGGIATGTVRGWEKRFPDFAKALEVVRKKHAFLAAYRRFGTEYMAATRARTTPGTHKRWLEDDLAYAEAFQQVRQDAMDLAETELRMRGIYGHKKPVFYKGMQVATVVEKDTTALIFHLKGRRREVYGDKTEVSGAGGGPLQLQLVERLQAGRLRVAQRQLPESATPPVTEGVLLSDKDE